MVELLRAGAIQHTESRRASASLPAGTGGMARGADMNEAAAMKWREAAARDGNKEAQYELGCAHFDGTGGYTKDSRKGLVYFLKAAQEVDTFFFCARICTRTHANAFARTRTHAHGRAPEPAPAYHTAPAPTHELIGTPSPRPSCKGGQSPTWPAVSSVPLSPLTRTSSPSAGTSCTASWGR